MKRQENIAVHVSKIAYAGPIAGPKRISLKLNRAFIECCCGSENLFGLDDKCGEDDITEYVWDELEAKLGLEVEDFEYYI